MRMIECHTSISDVKAVDFAELFLTHHEKIRQYIYRRTSDMELSEDLAVEVFVKAIAATGRGNGAQIHASGWLYRIAHNLIIDHYKACDRHSHVNIEDCLNVSSGYCLEAEFELRELQESVVDAARYATEVQQQVILLRLEGYGFIEIATLMNKSEGAVKAIQVRAFDAMCPHLIEYARGKGRPKREKETNTQRIVSDCLRQYGPMTVRELSNATGIRRQSIHHAIQQHSHLFIQVDTRHSPYRNHAVCVWGVRP